MSKNMTKHRNKWLDEESYEYNENYQQIKKKTKDVVDVKRDKNKTQTRIRQPSYENVVSTYGYEEDWY